MTLTVSVVDECRSNAESMSIDSTKCDYFIQVSSAPKISKRKKFVPHDMDDDENQNRKSSYKKDSSKGLVSHLADAGISLFFVFLTRRFVLCSGKKSSPIFGPPPIVPITRKTWTNPTPSALTVSVTILIQIQYHQEIAIHNCCNFLEEC